MGSNADSGEFPQKRRKQLVEMYVLMCGWVFVDAHTYVCVGVCMRKPVYECVCGIPTAQQIRKVTPNSQSGAELSIKGNL